ncbi:MAG: restriction endonuclease [Campylobacterales bacterium]|nr:restriction endonuclease [Campylobacterales bacterium]
MESAEALFLTAFFGSILLGSIKSGTKAPRKSRRYKKQQNENYYYQDMFNDLKKNDMYAQNVGYGNFQQKKQTPFEEYAYRTRKKRVVVNVTDLAKILNTTGKELNIAFENIGFIERRGKWILATRKGESFGASQEYDHKRKIEYVMWDIEVQYSRELIQELEKMKNQANASQQRKMSDEEKREKGAKYEAFVAEYFRKEGCYVWEKGKEEGRLDGGLDLVVKKEKSFYFVQCKNWETWKINDKDVKATRQDAREYLKRNPAFIKLLNGYEMKILYVTSKECLTAGAWRYIQENKEIVDYQVIPYETIT